MADPVIEPLVLLCPACGRQHIDEGDLAVLPHTEHVCTATIGDEQRVCKHRWRPREHATVGVPVGTLSTEWCERVAELLGDSAAAVIADRWLRREHLTPAKAKAEMLALYDEWMDTDIIDVDAVELRPPRVLGDGQAVSIPDERRPRLAPETTWGGRSRA